MRGISKMESFDRKKYKDYRDNRMDDESYFPDDVQHKDTYFSVHDKLFVWDYAKNEANITEHGIDFYTAAYVFNDEFRLEDDNRTVNGEEREQTIGEPMDATDQKHAINTKSARPKVVIGEVEGILFVVFVKKAVETEQEIRIISARAANKKEAEAYLMSKYESYLV